LTDMNHPELLSTITLTATQVNSAQRRFVRHHSAAT